MPVVLQIEGLTKSFGANVLFRNLTLTLNEGDSVYFDATQPHGMRTLNEHPVRFLAIIF